MYIKVFSMIKIPIAINTILYFYMMFTSAFMYIILSLHLSCEVPEAGDIILILHLKRLEQRLSECPIITEPNSKNWIRTKVSYLLEWDDTNTNIIHKIFFHFISYIHLFIALIAKILFQIDETKAFIRKQYITIVDFGATSTANMLSPLLFMQFLLSSLFMWIITLLSVYKKRFYKLIVLSLINTDKYNEN